MNYTTKIRQNIGWAVARPSPPVLPALESGEVERFLPSTGDHNSRTVLNKLHYTFCRRRSAFNLKCSPVTLLENVSVVTSMGQVLHLLATQRKLPGGSLVLRDIAMRTNRSCKFLVNGRQ